MVERRAGILIVEDRSLVAGKLARELERGGFRIAGMAATRRQAARLAETAAIGAAVLDIDLRGESVFPVAEVLHRRRVPFIFLTGYSAVALPPQWQHILLVEKPFEGPR